MIKRDHHHRHRWNMVLMLTLVFMATAFSAGCSKDTDTTQEPPPGQGETMVSPGDPVEETPFAESPSEGQPEEGEMSSEELKDLFRTGRSLEELHYEMSHTGVTEGPMVTEIWIKGKNMKSETEVMDNKIIMIMNDEGMYTLTEDEKVALKIPLGDLTEQFRKDTYSIEDYTENVEDAELIYKGKESVNGVSCHVVESKSEDYLGGVRMWLHEEYGFPMRMESIDADQEGSFTMEVTSFVTGNVSDDEFLIPEDYQIMDFGSFNLPQLPVNP